MCLHSVKKADSTTLRTGPVVSRQTQNKAHPKLKHQTLKLGAHPGPRLDQPLNVKSYMTICQATLHRVVPITGTTDRYSMPLDGC